MDNIREAIAGCLAADMELVVVSGSIPIPQSHRDELNARLSLLNRGESEPLDRDEALRRIRG